MSAPIYGNLELTCSIDAGDLTTIKGEGFPKHATSADRFSHSGEPLKVVKQSYETIASVLTGELDPTIPDWAKEIISDAEGSGGEEQLLVRETHDGRLFRVALTVVTE